MEFSDYVQSRETVHSETTASLEDWNESASSGTLACTDSRLLYASGKRITDIRLPSINEMTVVAPTYLNRFAFWAVLFLFLSPLSYFGVPLIPEIQDLAVPISGVLLLLAVIEAALAIYYAKWTLIVRTQNSEYKYLSKDDSLQEIPQAVRGAE